MKWEFTRNAKGKQAYVVCNADEGEPGTFKDRVILTERPEMLFEGMAVAGYAIGASEGVLYLRAEYGYLLNYLNQTLAAMRKSNLLGKNIAGKKGFDFDITIKARRGRLYMRRGIGPDRIGRRQARRAAQPAARSRPRMGTGDIPRRSTTWRASARRHGSW